MLFPQLQACCSVTSVGVETVEIEIRTDDRRHWSVFGYFKLRMPIERGTETFRTPLPQSRPLLETQRPNKPTLQLELELGAGREYIHK